VRIPGALPKIREAANIMGKQQSIMEATKKAVGGPQEEVERSREQAK
jgi:hypothetical protein